MSGNAIGKRSSKFRIPKTSLGLDKTITKWNDEYEQMWNKINTNIEVCLAGDCGNGSFLSVDTNGMCIEFPEDTRRESSAGTDQFRGE